jgi:hypothetical protein
MKRIVLATLCVLVGMSTYAQTPSSPPSISPCSLSVAKAPAIRGVKLGMKVDEVLAVFPGSAENNEIKTTIGKADSFPHFGLVSVYVFPRDYETRDRFAGIADFRFTFFDGRVDQYEVDYEPPPGAPAWRRVDDWITKLADAFKLPPAADWAADQNLTSQKSLKCDGFQMRASNMNFRGSLLVSTLDSPLKKQQERRAAYEEKLRQEFKP